MAKWLRWYIGTTENGKIKVAAKMSRVTQRDVIALWAAMLEDAANPDHRGRCLHSADYLEMALDFESGQVQQLLDAMQSVKMIEHTADGISICNWNEKQFESDSDPTATERKRRERERKSQHVTRDTKEVTPPSRPPESDTESDSDKGYTGDFENCWAEYPKRSGSNDKKAAFRAYGARLKEGHAPADILAGVKRYAAWCRHTGKVNTETVKQAATFFGPADPPDFTLDWRAPGQSAPVAESKPLPCDESLRPYAKQLMAIEGVAYFNSWFAGCIVVEKEDWITLAAPTSFVADWIKKKHFGQLKKIFGDQFQVGHGRPKVDA